MFDVSVAAPGGGGRSCSWRACSSAALCSLGENTGKRRLMLCVGSTPPHSRTIFRYASPTGRMRRSRSYSPSALTVPLVSRSALSQSTWSVSEYHVKPTTGMPSLRTRSRLAHSFHSQNTASSPFGPWQMLVSVCMTGSR